MLNNDKYSSKNTIKFETITKNDQERGKTTTIAMKSSY